MQASPPALTPGPSVPSQVSSLLAVRRVFQDPQWKNNLLLGLVFLMIPMVGPIALSGWLCETHQRLARRHPNPVPRIDFSDFMHYLGRGVAPFVVGLVLSLPLMLSIYIALAVLSVGAFATFRESNEPALAIVFGGAGAIAIGSLALVASVFMNAAQTRAELTEDIGKALSPGELFRYARATWPSVMIKTVTFGLLSVGIALLGMMACYIGLYPAIMVLQIAALHLRFQIYERFLQGGAAPLELKPAQVLPSELNARNYARH